MTITKTLLTALHEDAIVSTQVDATTLAQITNIIETTLEDTNLFGLAIRTLQAEYKKIEWDNITPHVFREGYQAAIDTLTNRNT